LIVTDDNASLAESIVKYAERATIAESKVSAMEERLATLEINQQTTYPQTAYVCQLFSQNMQTSPPNCQRSSRHQQYK
jgi:type III secretion system FlhB-like substrate exporter